MYNSICNSVSLKWDIDRLKVTTVHWNASNIANDDFGNKYNNFWFQIKWYLVYLYFILNIWSNQAKTQNGYLVLKTYNQCLFQSKH